ncbi:histidine kinase [Nonomuraea sp. NBC_01738]|uniref:sensor histidine kinase n=1 Tax=Nonomuraea sp. NBC_01738 TaxID=2976003 RepID=UPI002E138D71|nr:histidine kinase [Nonomuraea sp. NBC_01738]
MNLREPAIRDAALAAALPAATVLLFDAAGGVRGNNGLPPDGPWPVQLTVWWGASAVCVLAVLLRRRLPVAALTAAVLATLAHMAVIAGPTPADLAAPILIYTVARRHPRKVSLALLGGVLVVAAAWSAYVALDGRRDGWAFGEPPGPHAELLVRPPPGKPEPLPVPEAENRLPAGPTGWGGLAVLAPALVTGWATGWSARSRRAYLEELTARARDLERERDQRAELAAAAERARITRELHDVVAHGLSVIVMQAQGGAAAFAKRPQDTLSALDTIVETGRASLADMRHVLAATGPSSPHPVPGLARLPRLLEQVRASGTPVSLRVDGPERTLPTAVDLAAYRIVQESLTNTMKHAGQGASARAEITYGGRELLVEIHDDGGTHPPSPGGNGLRGMRERVAVLGGSITAGPGADGFAVRARLPYANGAP